MKLSKLLLIIIICTTTSIAQSRYGYDLAPSIVVPVGKDSEFFKAGIGVNGGFYYDIESSTRVGVTLGYLRVGIDNGGINSFLKRNGVEGTMDLEGSLTAFPILFSLKILSPNQNIKLYGLLEAGLYIYWSKAKGNFTKNNSTSYIDESEFRSEPGIVIGMGSIFPINDEISLDFALKYHFVQDSEYLYNSAFNNTISTSQLLSITLGLNWDFVVVK